jgi:hypothetical protein
MMEKLINKEKNKKQKQIQTQQQQETKIPENKWIAYTYFSPLVRKVTNLFKQTKLKIAFRTTNMIQQQLAKYRLTKIQVVFIN